MKLDEIAAHWTALEQLLEETGGETSPEVAAWLAEYSLAEQDKVDGYVTMIKHLEGVAAAAMAQSEELEAKARTARNRIQWLKDRVGHYMEMRGLDLLPGHIWRFKFVSNGGLRALQITAPPVELPPFFTKTEVVADREKIRQYVIDHGPLTDADDRVLAQLAPRGQTLRIY